MDVREFGPEGDGETIQKAIDASGTGPLHLGCELFIPKGEWVLREPIILRKRVILAGEGGGAESGATTLMAEPDVPGLIVQYGGPDGWGDWSEIRSLTVSQRAKGAPVHGITLQARAHLVDVGVSHFAGHGIAVLGGGATNANNWQATYCRMAFNSGWGMFLQGDDSNAGSAVQCDASNNHAGGFGDYSFLGNNFFSCHTAANEGPCYAHHKGGASKTNFVGCYSEVGQPPAQVYSPGMWLGGNPGAGFSKDCTGTIFDGATWKRIVSDDGKVKTYAGVGDGKTPLAWKGWGELATTGFTISDAFGGAWPKGWWALSHNANPNFVGFAIAGGSAQFRGLQCQPGIAMLPNGFILGGDYPGNGKRHTVGSSPPSNRYSEQGDIVWNSGPTPGAPIGWVCTFYGTPGTWKAFGKVEP